MVVCEYSPYTEHGKLLLNCTEELIQGNIESYAFFSYTILNLQ